MVTSPGKEEVAGSHLADHIKFLKHGSIISSSKKWVLRAELGTESAGQRPRSLNGQSSDLGVHSQRPCTPYMRCTIRLKDHLHRIRKTYSLSIITYPLPIDSHSDLFLKSYWHTIGAQDAVDLEVMKLKSERLTDNTNTTGGRSTMKTTFVYFRGVR